MTYDIRTTTAAARERLELAVQNGVAQAGPVIERVLSQIPNDKIVKASALNFEITNSGALTATAGGEELGGLHTHAVSQILERVSVPKTYATSLLEPLAKDGSGGWRHRLLEHVLSEHHVHSDSRYLVRSQGGQVRGVLSDQYRRLDSRPLLEAFVGACQSLGAVPYDGVASDLRVSVRAIVPQVFEPVPGEAMVFGLSWNNSDFGAGVYGISAFVLRLVCLNGMVGQSALKQVHIGKRLDDNLEYSQRTYELDTKTMASATGDMVKHLLGPKVLEQKAELVRAAHATEVDFAKAWRSVGAGLTKPDQQRVKEAFEGPDVVMMPPGKTLWRFSNALSWVANQTENAERKLELQQVAGQVLAA